MSEIRGEFGGIIIPVFRRDFEWELQRCTFFDGRLTWKSSRLPIATFGEFVSRAGINLFGQLVHGGTGHS
jgi:hypothetical protein